MDFNFPLCEVEVMTYITYIYGIYKSNSQHNRTTFPYFLLILLFFISIISFSQASSVYLPVCVAFCLIHLTVAVVNKSRKIIFFRTILFYLEPFCPWGIQGQYGSRDLTLPCSGTTSTKEILSYTKYADNTAKIKIR